MTITSPTREEALRLLSSYNSQESHLRHALAVEAVMRHFARRFGEDEETWAVMGLVHDLDYEQFPDEHCQRSAQILRTEGWPQELIRAVVSHGFGHCSDVEPRSLMERVLYAVDELTGLVATTALVRPSRSVLDTEARSVKKKWKDRRFAAGVDRAVIERGAQMLQMDLGDLITETILGMRAVADAIGLRGNPETYY